MAMTWDLTDIPAVDAADLAAAMRSLIEDGRGLVLLNGASEADLDTARAALQSRHHAEPQRALAAFVRFRHLVEVFGARRLKDLMLDNGYALMAPAIAIAVFAAPQRQPRLQSAALSPVAAGSSGRQRRDPRDAPRRRSQRWPQADASSPPKERRPAARGRSGASTAPPRQQRQPVRRRSAASRPPSIGSVDVLIVDGGQHAALDRPCRRARRAIAAHSVSFRGLAAESTPAPPRRSPSRIISQGVGELHARPS